MAFLGFSNPTARTALAYVTLGGVGLAWSAVGWLYLANYPPDGPVAYYVAGGFTLTSLVLLGIGLIFGYLFRTAGPAEAPPPPPPEERGPDVPVNIVASNLAAKNDVNPIQGSKGLR
jgi:hypothetical protein